MKKGSITPYLCLVLCVLLSLISAAYYSARISAGRVALAAGLEQSLYSLFGEYDRELFEEYGLLMIDGGRGSDSLQLHRLTGEAEAYASYILNPGKNLLDAGSLTAMADPEASILSYTLATDGGGAAFARQICTAMKGKLAAGAAGLLKEQLEESRGTSDRQVEQMGKASSDTSVSEQEQAAADAIEIDESYRDPRQTVVEARKLGILRLAVPAGYVVSENTADLSTFPSGRTLQRGIGTPGLQKGGIVDHALLMEYASEMFPCFTSGHTGSGLQYQQEYLITGKASDVENLKGTLTRLLVIREASNIAYLAANPQKRAESLAAATAVCSAIGMPYLAPAAAAGIRAAWAYAESIMDLRNLLSGGKTALVKTDETWKLSIEQLPQFLSHKNQAAQNDAGGLTYQQYLKMLLAAKNSTGLTLGLMDLVEAALRQKSGKEMFRIDNCIDAMQMKLSSRVEGKQISIDEVYGYGNGL
ncbi:MAG: hypothetical protein IJ860_08145 [Eubacterium sp.]|nr:hypothetical protein [Eubacterium sp.]